MPIRYPDILDLHPAPVTVQWSPRDTMLYALGVGYGDAPLDPAALRFTYERDLLALPTFASTLASRGEPSPVELGIDATRMLHAGQKITLAQPFLPQGQATTLARIVSVQDKGSDKGALIVYAVDLLDPLTGCVIATTTSTLMARGDGGFGGPASMPIEPAPVPPQRDADAVITLVTQAHQALLYRLSGEMNPLHADPDLASAAGFERPILQGPCTFGMCLRAVLQAWPDLSPTRLRSHEVRYAAPVVPGDVLSMHLWRDGLEVLFEAAVPAKGLTVIRSGKSCFSQA